MTQGIRKNICFYITRCRRIVVFGCLVVYYIKYVEVEAFLILLGTKINKKCERIIETI